jgi:hypothetical protein
VILHPRPGTGIPTRCSSSHATSAPPTTPPPTSARRSSSRGSTTPSPWRRWSGRRGSTR